MARAAAQGIRVLAITDHDTIAGWSEASAAAVRQSIGLVPGVELSVTVDDREVHLLGYGFDPAHAGLRAHMEQFAAARRRRVERMIEKLQALGIDLPWEAVQQAAAGTQSIGRPHVAAALVEAGYVASYDAAFEQYLRQDGPAYARKPRFPVRDALELLHDAGGIGVVAHPGHWMSGRLLHRLRRAGLDGIEVQHPSHDATLVAYYQRVARDFGLAATGGSDYHGPGRDANTQLGERGLSRAEWQHIRDRVCRFGTAA